MVTVPTFKVLSMNSEKEMSKQNSAPPAACQSALTEYGVRHCREAVRQHSPSLSLPAGIPVFAEPSGKAGGGVGTGQRSRGTIQATGCRSAEIMRSPEKRICLSERSDLKSNACYELHFLPPEIMGSHWCVVTTQQNCAKRFGFVQMSHPQENWPLNGGRKWGHRAARGGEQVTGPSRAQRRTGRAEGGRQRVRRAAGQGDSTVPRSQLRRGGLRALGQLIAFSTSPNCIKEKAMMTRF